MVENNNNNNNNNHNNNINNDNVVNSSLSELDKLRGQLDVLDDKIVSLLVKRFAVVKAVKKFKSENIVPIFDSNRESNILDRLVSKSDDLNEDLIKDVYAIIFNYSRTLQSE